MNLKPLDIVVVDGLWYMPHHWLIRWRSLDPAVHCLTIKDEEGNGYNPLFTGIEINNISKYKGRKVTIHRYKYPIISSNNWCEHVYSKHKRYDFWKQWLLGFICGITIKSLADNPDAYTCSEFSYNVFQCNEMILTEKHEVCPMPRLFRYHRDFTTVFDGVL
jgi:hypothetical protein